MEVAGSEQEFYSNKELQILLSSLLFSSPLLQCFVPSSSSFVCISPSVCVCVTSQSKQRSRGRLVLSLSNTACCWKEYLLEETQRRTNGDREWKEHRKRRTVCGSLSAHLKAVLLLCCSAYANLMLIDHYPLLASAALISISGCELKLTKTTDMLGTLKEVMFDVRQEFNTYMLGAHQFLHSSVDSSVCSSAGGHLTIVFPRFSSYKDAPFIPNHDTITF